MNLLYNPGLLDVDALVRGFVVRTDLLAHVVADLRSPRPVHRLFVGQRGMGKTTLLRRVAAEIARDPALAQRWLALTFPEEQYNVVHLSDFWLNCLDAAADALQAAGKVEAVAAIDAFVAALPPDEEVRATRGLERLLAVAGAGRGLVLCVDNLQQVLGRLDEREQWALRRVLGDRADLVLLAAAPAAPEGASDYRAPFFEFLDTTRLEALDFDAGLRLLAALGERAGHPELRDRLQASRARVHALHTLAGGNPRTVAMLADVLLADPGADVRPLLDGLVDRATPLYKARFEELAEQAQVVLGALALAWHPTAAATLAAATHLEVGTVSTQLTRLHQEGLVLKVEIEGEARVGYLVAERFFNLWYLMRASRRLRGRVLGFALCLEAIYDADALAGLATRLLSTSEDTELLAAVSKVVRDEADRRALWSRVPRAELAEAVAEPEAVAYAERVDFNRRFALRYERTHGKHVLGLDQAGATARGLGTVHAAAEEAYRLGLLGPDSDLVDVRAAARRLNAPALPAYYLWASGRSVPEAELARCDEPTVVVFIAMKQSIPVGVIEAAAARTEDAAQLSVLAARALVQGDVDVAARLQCAAVELTLGPSRRMEWRALCTAVPVDLAGRLAFPMLAVLEFVPPGLLLAAYDPDLPDAMRAQTGAALAEMLSTVDRPASRTALSLLSDRVRDENLPLAVAIDVVTQQRPGLLSRYAPEVQTGARAVLDQIWPAWKDQRPGPTSAKRRTPRRR